jgi:hypothetical protein
MTQRQKQISVGAGAVILIVTGVFAWYHRPANNANVPRGVWFICTNDSCKNEFSMTMAQFSDHQEKHWPAGALPQMRQRRGEGRQCPYCGKVFFRLQQRRLPCLRKTYRCRG